MDLLFRREQTSGNLTRVDFKLWGKIELDEEEQALVKRYCFDQAVLIAVDQPDLVRRGLIRGVVVFIIVVIFAIGALGAAGVLAGIAAGFGFTWWWINDNRETIFVRDLMHGRHFSCDSVVELARKEAWLTTVVSYLRQVMVSAKHWDGTERHKIEPLPKDQAREVILRGL